MEAKVEPPGQTVVTSPGQYAATRRWALVAAVAGIPVGAPALNQDPCPASDWSHLKWGVGHEGQRIADLGDGTPLNPIMSGDRADPTILKDGREYYMTFSSFDAYPGVVIWRSRGLVNWAPIGPALTKQIASPRRRMLSATEASRTTVPSVLLNWTPTQELDRS